MVLSARLFIEDSELKDGIPLLSCTWSFSQGVDNRGYPSGDVLVGQIVMSFQSMDDGDLQAWMIIPHWSRKGAIEFSSAESSKLFKKLEFSDGQCVSWYETFSHNNEMITELTISAREISISRCNICNDWPGGNGE